MKFISRFHPLYYIEPGEARLTHPHRCTQIIGTCQPPLSVLAVARRTSTALAVQLQQRHQIVLGLTFRLGRLHAPSVLRRPQLGVETLRVQYQLRMGARLYHTAVLYNVNNIRVDNGGQPMCNE